ncbi:MAG: adenine phosphoribosyltransferase [Rhodanobacteraceae bacterium]
MNGADVGIDPGLHARLSALIRDVPDFPRAGVMFKDITPLVADAHGFRDCIAALAAGCHAARLDAVCGIEARGFIFGAALAHALGTGFVPLRKAGKLPATTLGVDFDLEYGQARLEVHADAVAPGSRTLLVDDVLATGGTLIAARELLRRLGAEVVAAAVVVELKFLNGRTRWPDEVPLRALIQF